MSITYIANEKLSTNSQSVIWNNQTNASISLFYRYDLDGSVDSSVLNTNYWLSRGLSSFYSFTQSNASGSLRLRWVIGISGGGSSQAYVTINQGTPYHFALVQE